MAAARLRDFGSTWTIPVLLSVLLLASCQIVDTPPNGFEDPIAVASCDQSKDQAKDQDRDQDRDRADCLMTRYKAHKTDIDSNFDALAFELVENQTNFDPFQWLDLGLDTWQIKTTRDLDKLNNRTAPTDDPTAMANLRNKRQSKSDDLNNLQMVGTAFKAVDVLLGMREEDMSELIQQMQANRRLIGNCIQQRIMTVRAGLGGYTTNELRVHLERYRYAGTLRAARTPTILTC